MKRRLILLASLSIACNCCHATSSPGTDEFADLLNVVHQANRELGELERQKGDVEPAIALDDEDFGELVTGIVASRDVSGDMRQAV